MITIDDNPGGKDLSTGQGGVQKGVKNGGRDTFGFSNHVNGECGTGKRHSLSTEA